MGMDIGANILVSAGTISESTVMLSVRCLEQWNLHFTVIYLSAGQQKKQLDFLKNPPERVFLCSFHFCLCQ